MAEDRQDRPEQGWPGRPVPDLPNAAAPASDFPAPTAPMRRPVFHRVPGGASPNHWRDAAEPDTGELPVSFPPAATHHDTKPLPLGLGGLPGRPRRTGRGRHFWIWPVAIALAVLGAGYAGASYYFANRVPKGASVAGIEIGGLTKEEAIGLLRDELSDKSKETISVTVGDQETFFDPVIA